jgi:uncharacterized repeat protein (TIGR03803 family)
MIATPAAQAQTFQTLITFGVGTNGSGPTGGLIQDSTGTFYGTTFWGGAYDFGLVFSLDSAGNEKVLYNFTGGSDGSHPWSGLVLDSAGNLYGTDTYGAAFNAGTVFRLSKNGKLTTLYTFTGGADGAYPRGGLVRDAAGNVYGVTQNGGDNSLTCFGFPGCGVAFKVAPGGKETTQHTFAMGTDGGFPYSALILDTAGNLYGTTEYGGESEGVQCAGATSFGCGTVFKIDPAGNETVLHRFHWGVGVDGALPLGGLVMDAEGNLYGTTSYGGSVSACQGFGCGSVFKLDESGNETLLHTFGHADGIGPFATLIRDADGNLYGTTYNGGKAGFGTVFMVDAAGKETVLHSFTGGSDGANPTASLFRDSAGNLYGTASSGGDGNNGVVFMLKQ